MLSIPLYIYRIKHFQFNSYDYEEKKKQQKTLDQLGWISCIPNEQRICPPRYEVKAKNASSDTYHFQDAGVF
jgi:hypothetical protein